MSYREKRKEKTKRPSEMPELMRPSGPGGAGNFPDGIKGTFLKQIPSEQQAYLASKQ